MLLAHFFELQVSQVYDMNVFSSDVCVSSLSLPNYRESGECLVSF